MGGELPQVDTIPQREVYEKQRVPELGTVGGDVFRSDFDPEKPIQKPRNMWQRYQGALSFMFINHLSGDPDRPDAIGYNRTQNHQISWREFFSSQSPLHPDLYRDPYQRTKPCDEKHEIQHWRHSRYQRLNPKIPPPVDGKFNDVYHWLAYKNWYRMEREVYIGHVQGLGAALERCWLKEGVNTAKNCRHLYNKVMAMTRMEEQNQMLLYIAITGNAAIRETPYPEDFVEQKRKIYDDWLFRSRMKKPGDVM